MQRVVDGVAKMKMLRTLNTRTEEQVTWLRAMGIAMDCPWLDGMVANSRSLLAEKFPFFEQE